MRSDIIKHKLRKVKYLILKLMLLSIMLTIYSCSTEPEPINFGKDQCEHCKMTIADPKFGAEIITGKGKVYKFDAIECLINYVKEGRIERNEISRYLVINASKPKMLIDAEPAVYLRSEKFPSPMGEFLSAYQSRTEAQEFYDKYQGTYLTWNDLFGLIKTMQ